MKLFLLVLLALSTARCSKNAVADEQACACASKLVPSKTEWFNGQLCPAKDKAGVNYKAQGSGRNAQGYVVVGCYTEKVESLCECKPK